MLLANWAHLARCKNDPDQMFVIGADQNVAKRICKSCPVRNECLVEALDGKIEKGVWGGMTERERRALLRRHPQVTSWRKMFEAAMRKQGNKENVRPPRKPRGRPGWRRRSI